MRRQNGKKQHEEVVRLSERCPNTSTRNQTTLAMGSTRRTAFAQELPSSLPTSPGIYNCVKFSETNPTSGELALGVPPALSLVLWIPEIRSTTRRNTTPGRRDFKSKTQQKNCRNIKGATVVAVVVCATKPTLLLMYWELITCRTIDVVRFQQLRCKKRSSLTRKAALSANVLLRHQAVPAPLGLRVQRGETARHNPITLMQYNPITLIRYHAWRVSHPEPRFFTDAEMDIAV